MSLSAYLLDIVEREAEEPTLEEVLKRIKSRPPVELGQSSAAIIRELRDDMG